MSTTQLALTNIINISVAASQTGLGQYNTSNLAIFTSEVHANSFGDDDFKIYLSPQEVGVDFGTDSNTYKQAVAVFSQQPNILAGNGYLVVCLMGFAQQHYQLNNVAASGSFTMIFATGTTASIAWNSTESQMQTIIRAVPGFEGVVVTGAISDEEFDIDFKGVYGHVALPTFGGPGLETASMAPITITPTVTGAGETIENAISDKATKVQFFGIMASLVVPDGDILDAASVVQTMNKIAFWVQSDPGSVESGGILDQLTTGSLHQNRGLFYGDSDNCLFMQAAYAGRALSTNFNGSNTTSTMHLKDLIGIQPDPLITQTLLNKCQDAGADVYASFQGVPKVFCSGANEFFDQAYNLQWFIGALQVAGFNFLAQSATKVPQTENGMDGLKTAYRNVCQLAVTNAYSAPGQWNSSTTFGNQADFLANIIQVGYYIYSLPISQQSQAAREAREAPLVQIALKEAGAIHKSNIIVYVNA